MKSKRPFMYLTTAAGGLLTLFSGALHADNLSGLNNQYIQLRVPETSQCVQMPDTISNGSYPTLQPCNWSQSQLFKVVPVPGNHLVRLRSVQDDDYCLDNNFGMASSDYYLYQCSTDGSAHAANQQLTLMRTHNNKVVLRFTGQNTLSVANSNTGTPMSQATLDPLDTSQQWDIIRYRGTSGINQYNGLAFQMQIDEGFCVEADDSNGIFTTQNCRNPGNDFQSQDFFFRTVDNKLQMGTELGSLACLQANASLGRLTFTRDPEDCSKVINTASSGNTIDHSKLAYNNTSQKTQLVFNFGSNQGIVGVYRRRTSYNSYLFAYPNGLDENQAFFYNDVVNIVPTSWAEQGRTTKDLVNQYIQVRKPGTDQCIGFTDSTIQSGSTFLSLQTCSWSLSQLFRVAASSDNSGYVQLKSAHDESFCIDNSTNNLGAAYYLVSCRAGSDATNLAHQQVAILEAEGNQLFFHSRNKNTFAVANNNSNTAVSRTDLNPADSRQQWEVIRYGAKSGVDKYRGLSFQLQTQRSSWPIAIRRGALISGNPGSTLTEIFTFNTTNATALGIFTQESAHSCLAINYSNLNSSIFLASDPVCNGPRVNTQNPGYSNFVNPSRLELNTSRQQIRIENIFVNPDTGARVDTAIGFHDPGLASGFVNARLSRINNLNTSAYDYSPVIIPLKWNR